MFSFVFTSIGSLIKQYFLVDKILTFIYWPIKLGYLGTRT